MESLRVALVGNTGSRSYPIHIGAGILADAALYAPYLRGSAAIVTNAVVAPLYLESVRTALQGARVTEVIVPDGEQAKGWETLQRVFDALLAGRCGRDTLLVALGGGVVGDLAGFAAAVYQRGIDFVQVPTTLLAQVDSSVGGKTAINAAAGKNLLGAFYQPRLVLADTATLATLPRRELRAGYAEIVKYGLIRDSAFFDWLEANGDAVCDLEPAALTHAITVSCRMKAAVVAADEREAGDRELLNFGHTFGHALEAETGFSDRLLHGEAVALGMALAFDFAVRLGLASGQDSHRVQRHLATAGLPTELATVGLSGRDADKLLAHMSKDKKVRDGRITLILPRRIGDAFRTSDVSMQELRAFLAEAR